MVVVERFNNGFISCSNESEEFPRIRTLFFEILPICICSWPGLSSARSYDRHHLLKRGVQFQRKKSDIRKCEIGSYEDAAVALTRYRFTHP